MTDDDSVRAAAFLANMNAKEARLRAMDREHRGLFVAGSEPAILVVMNADDGKVIQSFPMSGGADADVYDQQAA